MNFTEPRIFLLWILHLLTHIVRTSVCQYSRVLFIFDCICISMIEGAKLKLYLTLAFIKIC